VKLPGTGQFCRWPGTGRVALNVKSTLEVFSGGTAFLPWEKWFARLVHKLAVANRRGWSTEYNDGGV
jgi:hypothetical protein